MKKEREKWRNIPGYEGYYQASSLGRVRSCDRLVKSSDGRIKIFSSVVLRQANQRSTTPGKNYKTVNLVVQGKGKTFGVHRLVALAFIPNPEGKPEVNHKNGNPSDNRVRNLEWVTRKENIDHARFWGYRDYSLLDVKGSKNGNAKLCEADILVIRKRLEAGETCSNIALDYSVSGMTIGYIRSGKIWAHVMG